jgi:GntR family transcriptional regulator, sialic acid-inducible nan operon repressor
LIEINHGERARVSVPDTRFMFDRIGQTMLHLFQTSPTTLQHLKQARVMFEVGMVKMAAARATAEDIQKLKDALDRQRNCAADAPEFIRGDMAFHTAIAAVSGNSVCVLPGSELITLAEHERLLEAIAAHDVAGAATAMEEHLTRANERYRILEDAMAGRTLPGGGTQRNHA